MMTLLGFVSPAFACSLLPTLLGLATKHKVRLLSPSPELGRHCSSAWVSGFSEVQTLPGILHGGERLRQPSCAVLDPKQSWWLQQHRWGLHHDKISSRHKDMAVHHISAISECQPALI